MTETVEPQPATLTGGGDQPQLLIGGRWADPHSTETLEVHSPATGERVGSVPLADATDVDAAVARLRALVEEYDAVEVIVGLPKTLRNTDGPAADKARAFGTRLAEGLEGISVVFSDERLTTVAAQQALHASGRSVKASRGVIDQAAAVAILQGWLDSRR